jgi:hypothetical protein
MSRKLPFIALSAAILGLAAFRSEDPFAYDRPFPVNSLAAHHFLEEERGLPSWSEAIVPEVDSLSSFKVLMLNYFAYDSAYAQRVQRAIQGRMPLSVFSEFWAGSPDELGASLAGQDVVIAAYPSEGSAETIKAYGKALSQFARQGGIVVLTGTHEFSILQQLGLFDLDFGYYCKGKRVNQTLADHPVFQGMEAELNTEVYQYPLDISDPNFVTLADVRGYPFVGFKQVGGGKVFYIGLEYYYDEPQSSRLLANALRWGVKTRVKRSEEVLYAGKGTDNRQPSFNLKIYPNPYVSKATLDVELSKATSLSVEMTDELGRPVATLLPKRSLAAGLYRFELPNVAPGVYFVRCMTNEAKEVRKVVKTSAN